MSFASRKRKDNFSSKSDSENSALNEKFSDQMRWVGKTEFARNPVSLLSICWFEVNLSCYLKMCSCVLRFGTRRHIFTICFKGKELSQRHESRLISLRLNNSEDLAKEAGKILMAAKLAPSHQNSETSVKNEWGSFYCGTGLRSSIGNRITITKCEKSVERNSPKWAVEFYKSN